MKPAPKNPGPIGHLLILLHIWSIPRGFHLESRGVLSWWMGLEPTHVKGCNKHSGWSSVLQTTRDYSCWLHKFTVTSQQQLGHLGGFYGLYTWIRVPSDNWHCWNQNPVVKINKKCRWPCEALGLTLPTAMTTSKHKQDIVFLALRAGGCSPILQGLRTAMHMGTEIAGVNRTKTTSGLFWFHAIFPLPCYPCFSC